jgi:hypothetical protein
MFGQHNQYNVGKGVNSFKDFAFRLLAPPLRAYVFNAIGSPSNDLADTETKFTGIYPSWFWIISLSFSETLLERKLVDWVSTNKAFDFNSLEDTIKQYNRRL